MNESTTYWCGSYTPPQGTGTGLGLIERRGDELSWLGTAAALDSPSFVATHPTLEVIYAVEEHRGDLVALRRDGDAWVHHGEPRVAGVAACHVRVDDAGRFAVVTCWGDGRVLVYPLDADGRPLQPILGEASHDPDGRQSRAHASAQLGPGTFLTTDLGHDLVRAWRFDGERVTLLGALDVGLGSGPRHLAAAGDGRYFVVTEYSNEVLTLRADEHGLALLGRTPVLRDGMREGDTCSEIALHESGRWLVVGVRGSDRIALLAVGEDGTVTPVDDVDCGGGIPRHLLLDGDRIIVANQRSGGLAVLHLDPVAGALSPAVSTLAVGSPTCLAVAG
ncbi:beta-propeller fold lactonase family protein [Leifsonia sp. H3M29-4]|uniref:lactonase family protein n=1 Tax=Salinibacterium metalliresistens TaxID=3031321 RepID=UPI0023DA6A8B|nr:beta-propeller fold lactonase family protein [Salinibacterium metalliresistens]MDF1479557.1 beta-propeller fold lactonase family protein [Salinibacterium metalliresistens]